MTGTMQQQCPDASYAPYLDLLLHGNVVENVVVPIYSLAVLLYLLHQYLQRRYGQQKDTDKLEPKAQPQQEVVPAKPKDQPIDLTGKYKLKSVENLDAFLAAQGVPYLLRRAADKLTPTHTITHNGTYLKIQIEAGITTSTTYTIGGDFAETEVRGRIFRDRVRYVHQDESHPQSSIVIGVITEKTAVSEGYQVSVQRTLVNGNIHILSKASFPNDPTKPDVISNQVFERLE